MEVTCPSCKNLAPWVENKEKYGRNYGKSYMCYFCKPCGTYVGCHNNTRNPLGTMADKKTMEARKEAHSAFDPLWKEGYMSRGRAYAILNELMGRITHIGESDYDTCKLITKHILLFRGIENN